MSHNFIGTEKVVNVLSVNYYSGKFVELMTRSLLLLNPFIKFNFYIFDNGSTDGSLNFLNKSELVNIKLVSVENNYEEGSYNHAFALDYLINEVEHDPCDAFLLIDSDCFSLKKDWLSEFLTDILIGNMDVVGVPAYCPTICKDNEYLWPGFTLMRPNVILKIKEMKWSYIPKPSHNKPNDSGQLASSQIIEYGFRYHYLERTKPIPVGNVSMEKWSIESTVHHFFAASAGRGFLKQFCYIYGDKTRGRYISKKIKTWHLFRQTEIKGLMKQAF